MLGLTMDIFSKRSRQIIAILLLILSSIALADDGPTSDTVTLESESTNERNFYQVLEDLLSDFEFDLKDGTPKPSDMSQLSIRNILVNENVPTSFKSHLELLITERILKITKVKIIQCTPCRAKKASLTGDQMIISSPESNPNEMARIAHTAGIEHFMDIAFTYQPTGMVLSMTLTDPETGSILWSRNYNSELSRSAAIRRGVDYSQVDEARKFTEYQPQIQYRTTVYYLLEPNIKTSTGTLGIGLRIVERYDNRKKEVGFEINYLRDSSTLVGKKITTGTMDLYSSTNLSLLFLHSWNLIGSEENYNSIRSNILISAGGTYASGFLGALIRGQYEFRMGKHYGASAVLGYRPTSTAFIGGNSAGSISGFEYGLGIHLLF